MKKLLILLFSILISFNSYGSYHSYSETICVDTDAQEKVALFTYQIRPNHLVVKTYVNMKMVRKSQREILKMARKMASELVGMRMVRKRQRKTTKTERKMARRLCGMRMVR